MMFVIIGLNNPGAAYTDTRHNAGAIAVRAFQEQSGLPAFVPSRAYAGELSEGAVAGTEVRLVLPTTFMNASGSAAQKAIGDMPADRLVVVHDDLDLPIGEMKVSTGKGSGGHNGVASIERALHSRAFVRVRIGIAPVSLFGTMRRPPAARAARFVLQKFTRHERAKLDILLPTITGALRTIITSDADAAMREYN